VTHGLVIPHLHQLLLVPKVAVELLILVTLAAQAARRRRVSALALFLAALAAIVTLSGPTLVAVARRRA
jgi:hypothetical protein